MAWGWLAAVVGVGLACSTGGTGSTWPGVQLKVETGKAKVDGHAVAGSAHEAITLDNGFVRLVLSLDGVAVEELGADFHGKAAYKSISAKEPGDPRRPKRRAIVIEAKVENGFGHEFGRMCGHAYAHVFTPVCRTSLACRGAQAIRSRRRRP